MKLDDILQLLHGVKKTSRGFMAYCPGHDDGAKCGRNGKEGQSLEIWQDNDSVGLKCYAGCARDAILKAVNLTNADLKIGNNGNGHKPRQEKREVAHYDYLDLSGNLLFQVVRYEPKNFRQRRPDGNGGFIWDLKGIEPVLYHLPDVKKAVENGSVLYIVEGEKDADAARMMGLTATTSPMGAGKWRKSYTESLLGARSVVIVADKDDPGRKHAADVAGELRHAGVENVKVIEMPGPGKDFSDWLANGGVMPELEAAIAASPLWMPPVPTSEDAEAIRGERLKEISGEIYCIENGRICHRQVNKDLQETINPLCNFTAHVTEEITRDDGMEANKFFKVRGRSSSGINLPEIEVPAANFAGLNWVVGEWGMRAIIGAGMNAKDKLREAIQLMSQDATARHIYTHTGWRHHDGKDIYLTQGGAIGADNVDVDLESQLKRYQMPAPDPDRTIEAVRASMDYIYIVSDPHVTIPLWAAMYLAPLADAIDLAFTLWLVGPSGSFKSTLTGLVLNHFGDFDQNHLPASWQDTSNLLQKLLFLCKDAPLVIDDWAPGQDHGKARELEAKAEHVIRSQGNRQGRGRMNKDTSTRGNYIPRGLLITSGEQTPSGHSHTARIFTVPLERDQVNLDMLTEAQRHRRRYGYAMAAYLAWLQPNWLERKLELRSRFNEIRAELLDSAKAKGIHPRLPDVIAMMQLGLANGAKFALEIGAIDQDTHDTLCSDGMQCFIDLAAEQGGRVEEERPARRFVEALQSSINMGSAYLRNKADMSLIDPGPGKVAIGWRDYSNGHVLLEPLAAHQTVVQFCQRSGRPYTISPSETWKDLCRERMADLGPDGRPTAMARITALPKPVRVVRLKSEFLGFEGEHEQ
ncbi:toprim domain-containing protein [Dehalogenimonas alkenigignens]|uniref:toprim domain-containing protein n=1 Tax=Dehalogenimonas alkenigignens TaxID=1217799 RepID=UPI000D5826D2|nr:toprim domain-containing protein [Dehalogenimonas alkenigignens]PVV83527.1 DNA primase [Dehalogenimonas alkenigignens]